MNEDHRWIAHGCPDDETLSAWLDGQLERADADAVEEHVSTCEDCLLLVASFAGASDADQVSDDVRPPDAGRASTRPYASAWRRARFLLPLAASMLVAVGLATVALRPRSTPTSALEALRSAAASADRRSTYGRLSGFAWAAPPLTLRSGVSGGAPVAPSLRAAAASIEASYGSSSTAEGLHAYGVALLVSGETDRAVAALSKAAASEPRSAARLADAAAACVQSGVTNGDADALAKARRFAEEAVVLDEASAAAWFNLALVGRATGDVTLVDRAQAALARIEPQSPWLADIDRP